LINQGVHWKIKESPSIEGLSFDTEY
jgi:hypothetical protein